MTIPTISSVSPATGPCAGGNLITLTGTNFKTPTVAYAIPMEDATPTVGVTIGGRSAPLVEVLSATEARVRVPRIWHTDPRTDAFTASDIVLSNLDDDGDAIAGETVTLSGGYTYARWDLGAPAKDPPLLKITKELIWALMLEVERHVYQSVHWEYGEEGSATRISLASLPSVNMTVDTPKDVEYSAWDNTPEEVERTDGSYGRYFGARTHMLQVRLYLTGEGSLEASHLCKAIEQFVQINPELRVLADQDLYPGEEDDYFIEITRDATVISSPNDSTVVTYMMELAVRGISVLPDEPTEIVKPITSFLLAVSDYSATAPREMSF